MSSGRSLIALLARRLSDGNARDRISTLLVVLPAMVCALAAATYWQLHDYFLHYPILVLILLSGVLLQFVLAIRLMFSRTIFRSYLDFFLFGAVLSEFFIGLMCYGFLEEKRSHLATTLTVEVVSAIALVVFIFDFGYRWRARWKIAFPYHVNAGEISADEGVNIFVPLGYNAPWERNAVRSASSGKLMWFFGFVAGVTLVAEAFGGSSTEWLLMLLSAACIMLVASNLAKYIILYGYLTRFEKNAGRPLRTQGA